MCGIAGIITNEAKNLQNNIDAMISSIKHRGPDGNSSHCFTNALLGHVRLSIVDINGGGQPMVSQDGNIGLVFNGEIYGYKEIKQQLSNFKFQTNSDTEVIIALYATHGEKFTEILPGMFSFALWDDNKQSLICARDRFGEKPFYYAKGGNGEFIFASEIKAIIASGLIEPIINKKSISNYLKRLYINPDETIYSNIYSLPPAHSLTYYNGKIKIEKYWKIPATDNHIKINEAVEKFRFLLKKSIDNQLIADVPVSGFLSGGLDSSTIIALASQSKANLTTFSFAFSEGANELQFAREISEKYHTNHIELRDDDADISQIILQMANIYDEPFADSSAIPTYLISKLASKHAKVALTGDGGDELFGGYDWYRPLSYFEKNNQNFFKEIIFRLAAKTILPINQKLAKEYYYQGVGNKLSRQFPDIISAHDNQTSYFTDSEINQLGLPSPDSTLTMNKESNDLNDVINMDINGYMTGDILTKIDRASMANGLELRAPFLDVDFASFCISLPHQLKVNSSDDKYILRKSFENLWPTSIKKRGKQGFGAPVKKWLESEKISNIKNEYLKDKNKRIFDILPYDSIQKYADKNNYQTWCLMILSLWLEKNHYPIK